VLGENWNQGKTGFALLEVLSENSIWLRIWRYCTHCTKYYIIEMWPIAYIKVFTEFRALFGRQYSSNRRHWIDRDSWTGASDSSLILLLLLLVWRLRQSRSIRTALLVSPDWTSYLVSGSHCYTSYLPQPVSISNQLLTQWVTKLIILGLLILWTRSSSRLLLVLLVLLQLLNFVIVRTN